MAAATSMEAFMSRLLTSGLAILALCVVMSTAQSKTRAVVIAGLGGNPEYTESFNEQTESIASALETITRDAAHVTLLQGADSNRAAFMAALASIAEDAEPLETVVVVMIGHANMNPAGWQFNVSGPDLSAEDLVAALAPLNAEREVVVASTSSSGALLTVLEQPGRSVITATKSAGETNAVRFSEYFAKALSSGDADVDRNELLTVKEAFTYANDQTVKYFDDQKLLAAEHARFEGADAANVTLATLGALRDAQGNPKIAALLDDRSVLEKTFYALKARKPELDAETYYQELERVLIDIATLQQSIDSVIEKGEWVE